jgi:hypothetical protein
MMSLSEKAQRGGIAEVPERHPNRRLAPTLATVGVIELVPIVKLGVIMSVQRSMSSGL